MSDDRADLDADLFAVLRGRVPTMARRSSCGACTPALSRTASGLFATIHPDMSTKSATKSAAQIASKSASKSARKPAMPSRLERENSYDEIYEKIYVAILEHRLHPGTKLVEERLAEIFGVSRARVREVLARLAHEQIVELYPQRGAYVAKPTIEQALDVFEARRLIEPAVLRRLIDTLTPEKLARLRQHQELEFDARRRDDKRAVIRLSGEFHSLAAELAGNTALARSMRELSVLTCLMIFLYDAPTSASCRPDEHSQIIDAVAKRDAARAERLMLEHLEHIESSMKLVNVAEEVDLEAIFKA